MAKAIRHALSRMPKVRPYLENGALSLDNNPAVKMSWIMIIGSVVLTILTVVLI